MSRPILHHYPLSPFAEKVRAAFGIKAIAWHGVEQPMVMPKPDLLPLTGGYRRIPVLQVGADIYCDTALIAAELERRWPAPPLMAPGTAGLSQMIGHWADRTLFWHVGRFITGAMPEAFPDSFHADRAAMWGVPVDIERMRRAAPRYRESLRQQLPWLEDALAARPFLLGPAPSQADIACYAACWFLQHVGGVALAELRPFPAILAWMGRIAAYGHGEMRPLRPADALAAAREARPATEWAVAADNPHGLAAGDTVSVAPDDYAKDAVTGRLVVLDDARVALARSDALVGEVVVHFPRQGYVVRRA